MAQQCLSLVPGHIGRLQCNVVALRGGNRNYRYMRKLQIHSQFFNFLLDLPVYPFLIADQIHFIDGKYKMPDSHKGANPGMAPCLNQDSL